MTDAAWTIDKLPCNYGLSGVWVDGDGGAVVAGSFVMMRRVARGPWEHVTVRGSLQHQAVSGFGSLRIAVGYPHSCVVSNDGGAKWANRSVGSKRKLDSIACLSEKQIFLAGEDGSFLSNDGGKKWASIGDMRYVAHGEAGLYAVSSEWKPVLHRWEDDAWRAVGPLPEQSNDLVVAADVILNIGSSVHRSVDGGATWSQVIPHRKNEYLISAAAHVTGRVVIVGYGGLIAVSEDYGVTWSEFRPTDRNLVGVCIAPDEEIWVVGDDGVLVRSGSDRAGDVAVRKAEVAVVENDPVVGTVLRPASPVPAWKPPEPIGAPIHRGTVSAAAFVDDDHAVTGDLAGRLVRLTRDGERWRCKTEELGGAITGLAAIDKRVFAILDGKLVELGGKPIKTTGKVTRIAARANRLAASGPKFVTTWNVDGDASTIAITGEPADLDISHDGAYVSYVIGDRVYTRAIASGKPAGEFRRKGAPRVRFTPNEKQFYLAGDTYHLGLVSVAKGGGRDKISTGNRERKLETSARGAMVATLSYGDEITVIETATGALLTSWSASDDTTLCGASRTVQGSQKSPQFALATVAVSDGGHVIVGDTGGEVAIIDAQRLSLQHAEVPRSKLVQVALDPPLIEVGVLAYGRGENEDVIVLGADHRLRFIDPDTAEVRAGPRIDIANVVGLYGFDDSVLLTTEDGWVGVDRQTGAQQWTTSSFTARSRVAYRGALYGFEYRGSYVVGERVHHRMFRLDVKTGEVSEVALAAHGYSYGLEAADGGLLATLDDDDGEREVLLDPDTGKAVDAPATIRRRDTGSEALQLGGVVASLRFNSHHVEFHHGDALVARIAGSGGVGSGSLYARRGEAIVSCIALGPVRRWPIPTH